MDLPLVSILMPAYNCEKYIAEAIRSMLSQTFSDFEFLIINDGSTDRTGKIIHSFEDNRIKIINNQTNVGIVSSLNNGIKLAQGELIARMDADDWSYPFRLAKQVALLKDNPEIGVCGSTISLWDGVDVVGNWVYPTNDDEIKANLFLKCSFAHPTVMYRKSLFSKNSLSYKAEFFPAEDYELWTKMARITNFHNFKDPLLKYRRSEAQISTTKNKDQDNVTFAIAWNQVLKLEIVDSADYRSLHKGFLCGPWPNNLNELQKLAKWLELILLANNKLNLFNNKYFSTELAKRYWKICYFSTSRHFKAIDLYRNSDFSKFYSPPFIQNIKGSLKNFLR